MATGTMGHGMEPEVEGGTVDSYSTAPRAHERSRHDGL